MLGGLNIALCVLAIGPPEMFSSFSPSAEAHRLVFHHHLNLTVSPVEHTASSRRFADCSAGVQDPSRKVCCSAACGLCGGRGCPGRPGGPRQCCVPAILSTGRVCESRADVACILRGSSNYIRGNGVEHHGSSGAVLAAAGGDSTPPASLSPMKLHPRLPPIRVKRTPHVHVGATNANAAATAIATAADASTTNASKLVPACPASALSRRHPCSAGCDVCGAPPGPSDDAAKQLSVAVVVSFCHSDLDWLHAALSPLNVQRLTVYSKCNPRSAVNQSVSRLSLSRVGGAEVVTLPNVGRCDHSFAHYLGERADFGADVILFLKDTHRIHQPALGRSLTKVVGLAASAGFACGQQPWGQLSAWHSSRDLLTLTMRKYIKSRSDFKSRFASMREWLRAFRWPGVAQLEAAPIWPVCYGGVFAASRSAASKVPRSFWNELSASLSRGDNIEEGHFTERLWAAVLGQPPDDAEALAAAAACKIAKNSNGLLGTLVGCRTHGVAVLLPTV